MDLQGFQMYRGYHYRVTANFCPDGEWRAAIDIRRQEPDGTIEEVFSHMDVPGQFPSEPIAREAADGYARVRVDQFDDVS
jgi:hypothetical protein